MARRIVYNETVPVRIYELAKAGLTEQQIAQNLGIHHTTLCIWKRDKLAVRHALDRARESIHDSTGQETFRDYIYKRLPGHLQDLWDKIDACDQSGNDLLRIEAMLKGAGKGARMHLFLYALVHSSFNPSEACRKVNISRSTYSKWMLEEPDFAALVDEINWHKGNFFEEALVKLVAEGEPSATVFVNRTFNRKRGYNEKVSIDWQGKPAVRNEFNVQVNNVKALLSRLSDDELKALKVIQDKYQVVATEAIGKEKSNGEQG